MVRTNKLGRPKKEETKRWPFKLRMSEQEIRMLEYIQKSTGKTKSEIMLGGLKMSYNLEKSKH